MPVAAKGQKPCLSFVMGGVPELRVEPDIGRETGNGSENRWRTDWEAVSAGRVDAQCADKKCIEWGAEAVFLGSGRLLQGAAHVRLTDSPGRWLATEARVIYG